MQRQFGQDQPARGFAEVTLDGGFRQDPAQHLVGAPAHGGHRGDAQALVDFGPAGIVDAGHHVLHMEGFARHAGGQDVGVVAAGDGGKGVGVFNVGLLERVLVKANAGDLAPAKTGAQAPEGPLVLVDDGHRVPGVLQGVGQGGAHTAATHDHKMCH